MRTRVGFVVAAVIAAAPVAVSAAPATGRTVQRTGSATSSAYPNATLSGSYTVTYQAAGDVDDIDGSGGTTHSTESYGYTVHITGLPIAPHYAGEPDTGFNGQNAEFKEPTRDGEIQPVGRYESVTDAHFSVVDPESNGTCDTALTISPTGSPTANGGLDVNFSPWDRRYSDLMGTNVTVPANLTSFTFNNACYTDPVDLVISPAFANEDEAHVLAHKGRWNPFQITLGQWSTTDGGNEYRSIIQPLFSRGPTTSCDGSPPMSFAVDSGSCTMTNSEPAKHATLTATISWSLRTSGVPTLHGTVAGGDHQTLHKGQYLKRPLAVVVRYPNGSHEYANTPVRWSVEGPAVLGSSNTTATDGRGIATLDSLKAKHRSGRVTVTARIVDAQAPVKFHLRVR